MSQTIDTLAIEIESNATNSVDGVRKLSRALTSLSKSISSVNGAGIGNVASSINLMSSAFENVGNTTTKATSGTKKYSSAMSTVNNITNNTVKHTKSLNLFKYVSCDSCCEATRKSNIRYNGLYGII